MIFKSYKNGSLTREIIRDETSEGAWDLFSQLLESTPRGNFGNIGNWSGFFSLYKITIQT